MIEVKKLSRPFPTRGMAAFFCILVLSSISIAGEPWLCNENPDVEHPLAWETLAQDVKNRVDQGEIPEAYRHVIDRYRALVAGTSGAAESSLDDSALKISNSFMQRILSGRPEGPEVWEGTEDPSRELMQYDFEELVDSGEKYIEIPCAAFKNQSNLKVEESTVYFFRAMRRVGAYGNLKHGQAGAAALASQTYESYDSLITNGLPMWPWELWLNGFLVPDEFGEPAEKTQVVFLRPTASPVLHIEGNEDSELDYGLVVEPLGFVRYQADDYSEWLGASVLVSLTNDNGVGYGAQFRWNEYTLGAAHHSKSDDVLFYVSIDLYELALGDNQKTSSAKKFLEGVKEKVLNRAQENGTEN